jgi:dUTP pyrophosphatase
MASNSAFTLGAEIGRGLLAQNGLQYVSNLVGGIFDAHFFEVEVVLENGVMPTRATIDSVGFDMRSCTSTVIPAGQRVRFDLGIKLIFKHKGMYAQICSRSGLACTQGIEVLGSGIIDPDYRHNLICWLENKSTSDYCVRAGDRICQLIFHPFHRVNLVNYKWNKEGQGQEEQQIITPAASAAPRLDLEDLYKRNGGFGSTGY